MSMRIKCPCGQLLTTTQASVAKHVRCPNCQQVLRVPAAKPAAEVLVDTFSAPARSSSQAASPSRASDPLHRNPHHHATRPKPNSPRPSRWMPGAIVAATMMGMIGVGIIAIWLLWAERDGVVDPITSNFEPIANIEKGERVNRENVAGENEFGARLPNPASVGRDANETAMLRIADQFVRHARENERKEAVAMIDSKLFYSRLYSANGSYEAMLNEIPVAKLLGNFGSYALDGAAVGGRRHWDVIGVSEFDGLPGVVLRYYVETKPPLEPLLEPALFDRMASMVSYDQFTQAAGNLLSKEGENTSQFDRYYLSEHMIHQAFPARAGYMMMVFDFQTETPKLVDLVNVMGQSPLSKSGAHVFLADFQMLGVKGSKDRYGTKPTQLSVYGISDAPGGAAWTRGDAEDERRAKQKLADEAARAAQKRPVRLAKLAQAYFKSDPSLDEELSDFRRDFPNDLGFEMAIVFAKMGSKNPTFTEAKDARVVTAAKTLFERWDDPFFLYVQALAASQNGDRVESDALFHRCIASGFATTDLFIQRLQVAVDESNVENILATLRQWSDAWALDDSSPHQEKRDRVASAYAKLEKSMNPDPTVGEVLRGGRGGPMGGRGGPMGGRGGRMGASNPRFAESPIQPEFGNPQESRPGGDRSGYGGPNGNRMGGRNAMGRDSAMGQPPIPSGRHVPSPMTGPQVVIKISSNHEFSGNDIAKGLAGKLGIRGYQFSQSNQAATLTLSYSGTLDSIAKAIDFGNVESADEKSKTITVVIP